MYDKQLRSASMRTADTGARAVGPTTIFVLGALVGLPPFSIDLYLPALPALTRDLHSSASAGQLTLTACVIGLAVGQLVAGGLSDRLGRRGPLLLGLGAYAAISAICAFAPSIWVLIALRLLQGAAGGAGVVVARAVVRDLCPGQESARVFALLMFVAGLTPVIAPVVGGQLLRVTDWRGLFLALGALGTLQLLLTARVLRETLPPERRHAAGVAPMLRRFGRLLGERAFLANGVAMNLAFAAFFAYISASSFVLEDIYHVSPQLFSVAFGLSSAMFIVVARSGARALPHFGAERLFAFGLRACGLATFGVLVSILAGWGPVALVACVCAINASLGLIWPNGTAVSMADSGELAGSASALLGLEQFGFAAIVAPLVGIAGSRTAVPTGIVMLACGGGAVLVHAARGRRPRAPATPVEGPIIANVSAR
jgi:DHA1 family bicyclomycin/chloramphenicol resistance-like MFS transporter